MAVPNYTYLKMKMPGPKGVITVGLSFEHAYECDVEWVEHAEAQAEDEALAATLDKMGSEAMDSTHRYAGNFEPAKGIKEVLTFEVVGFRGAYHAILGRPCYAKFMAVPNYTYLKMKMPGPKDIITIGPSFEHAYECDVECVEHALAQEEDEALAATLDKMASEAMDSMH